MFVRRYCSIGLYILFNLNVLCHGQQRPHYMSLSNGNVAYPEDEEKDPSKKNAQNKTPVYLANLCRPGEILYPGDQLDDWVCDCKPAYIYYPAMRQCYPAWTRGPCKSGEFLILVNGKVVPECQTNYCVNDNHVWFREGCYELDKEGPCALGTQISNVVGVNETTLDLICTKDYKIDFTVTRVMPDDDADGNKTTNNSSNGQTFTELPVRPDIPNPIVNGTIYTQRRCFVGGIRWLQTKCPEQNLQYNYNNGYNFYFNRNPNNNDNNNNYQNVNRDAQVHQNIQDIFLVPSLA